MSIKFNFGSHRLKIVPLMHKHQTLFEPFAVWTLSAINI